MSILNWMKRRRRNGQDRFASAPPIQTPTFEQLEPRVLLSADVLMPLASPLIETSNEAAIVVDYEESGADSVASDEWLVESEKPLDIYTAGTGDEQPVTSDQGGLSVSELVTTADLLVYKRMKRLPPWPTPRRN